MVDHCLSKQLLVSAMVGGQQAPGGQKLRWNDLVSRDLRACVLTENWLELSHNRGEWCRRVKEAEVEVNRIAESDEKTRKDTQKKV